MGENLFAHKTLVQAVAHGPHSDKAEQNIDPSNMCALSSCLPQDNLGLALCLQRSALGSPLLPLPHVSLGFQSCPEQPLLSYFTR